MLFKNTFFRFSLQNNEYLRKIIFRNRKLSRKPIRVLTQDGQYYDTAFQPKLDDIVEPIFNPSFNEKLKSTLDSNSETQESRGFFKEKILKPRLEGVPHYQKLGDKNNDFIKIMMHLKSKKLRERKDLLALEGKRLISDGIEAGLRLKTIYFSVEENLIGIKNLMELPDRGVAIKKVFYRDLKLFSEHVTSPGVIGIFERPTTELISRIHSQRKSPLPVTLVADNIRDPGNLGTIVRTAAAAGVDQVLCVKGCVDVWESKVVRSGCGAHFRVPIINNLDWPLIENYLPRRPAAVYLADSDCNVNQQKNLYKNAEIELITSNNKEDEKVIIDEKTGKLLKYNESFKNEDILRKYEDVALKTQNYSEIDYFERNESVILIIGSEAMGLSAESMKLCYDLGGSKLKIPLECGVESLNSSIAASIILYEIKRQFINK